MSQPAHPVKRRRHRGRRKNSQHLCPHRQGQTQTTREGPFARKIILYRMAVLLKSAVQAPRTMAKKKRWQEPRGRFLRKQKMCQQVWSIFYLRGIVLELISTTPYTNEEEIPCCPRPRFRSVQRSPLCRSPAHCSTCRHKHIGFHLSGGN